LEDWKQIVADLIDRGWTQTSLGLACGVTQAAVSQLARGDTTEPHHRFGSQLLKLHQSRSRSKPHAASLRKSVV
jgi:predicted transcriptional regulator